MKKIFDGARRRLASFAARARLAAGNPRGEGYVDSGVKILIAVVIGALLLSGLYTLFDDTIMPAVTERIEALFSYAG